MQKKVVKFQALISIPVLTQEISRVKCKSGFEGFGFGDQTLEKLKEVMHLNRKFLIRKQEGQLMWIEPFL